jgi:hypothetical protein
MQVSQLALLYATVLEATVCEPTSGVTVDAVPPGLKIGLMGFGVITDTTISSD